MEKTPSQSVITKQPLTEDYAKLQTCKPKNQYSGLSSWHLDVVFVEMLDISKNTTLDHAQREKARQVSEEAERLKIDIIFSNHADSCLTTYHA